MLGDAAGYVEPITGEGIAWALASARAIAPLALQAIERWHPRQGLAWSDTHRRLVLHRQLVCRASAIVLRQPWLTRLAFEVLSRAPGAAGRDSSAIECTSLLFEGELTMPMLIAGIGTAVPPHRIAQADAAEIAQQFSCETAAQERLFQSLYRRAGVETRHSVVLHGSDGDAG